MIENMTIEEFNIWQDTEHLDASSPEGKEYIHQYKYEVKIRIHGHLDKL